MNPQPNRVVRLLSFVIPWALLVTGMFVLPLQIMKKDLSKIPGDKGDARFNNYILEHGHRYMTGQISDYWNAPFMYPYKNTIAMSDNLLGTMPMYSFFRQAGADRETAFQIWILALFALNYLCCFLVLKKWIQEPVIAACGAYIFAFGIYNIGQVFHAQVFPRFIAPLVIYWSWRYLHTKELRYFSLMLLGLAYQFYCGIYLGFLLAYCLIFITAAYLIVFRKELDFSYLTKRKQLLYHLTALAGTALVLYPLFDPYIQISKEVGLRDWGEVYNSLPRMRSYFFTSPASTFWSKFLYDHSAYKFEGWWNHFLFIGALPWLALLAVPLILIRRNISVTEKKSVGAIVLGLAFVFFCCFRTQGITLWKLVDEIPGFASMRSLDRIINIEAFLFVLLFAMTASVLIRNARYKSLLLVGLPILTLGDNLIKPEEHKSFLKSEAIAQVEEAKHIIADARVQPDGAVAYSPVTYRSPGAEPDQNKLAETHMNAMLASQELGIGCVNGYSGFEPGNYSAYFHYPIRTTLNNWLAFNEADYSKVKIATGFPADIIETRNIQLKAFNGKFLCCDENIGSQIAANKDHADLWETFLLIRLSNGKAAILAHQNNYFSADLNNSGKLSAIKKRAFDWELFELTNVADNRVVLKAANGKYLRIFDDQGFINATDDTVTDNSTFEIIYK